MAGQNMEWMFDDATDLTTGDDALKESQKRECPFTSGGEITHSGTKRTAGPGTWSQPCEGAPATVSSLDYAVNWNHELATLSTGQAWDPVQPRMSVPQPTSLWPSMGNETGPRDFPGLGIDDTMRYRYSNITLQELSSRPHFQSEATSPSTQCPIPDSLGHGECDLGHKIPDFCRGDSRPNRTLTPVLEHEVSASNGIDAPSFAKPPSPENGTPLKASEFNSSNPTPSGAVLDYTPSPTVDDGRSVELKFGLTVSEEPSKQSDCGVPSRLWN